MCLGAILADEFLRQGKECAKKILLLAASCPTAPWQLCGLSLSFFQERAFRRGPCRLSSLRRRSCSWISRAASVSLRISTSSCFMAAITSLPPSTCLRYCSSCNSIETPAAGRPVLPLRHNLNQRFSRLYFSNDGFAQKLALFIAPPFCTTPILVQNTHLNQNYPRNPYFGATP